jgi:phage recombination protein Bet
MTNEVKERGLIIYQDRFGKDIKVSPPLVRKFLIQGRSEFVTDQEVYWFMSKCEALKLNPYLRDCYLIKYSQKENAQIIVAKEFYNARLDSQKDLEWWKAGIIVMRECKLCDGSGTRTVAPGEIQTSCEPCEGEGVIYKNRQGAMTRQGDTLVGGWFEAKKQRRTQSNYLEVSLPAYIKTTREGATTAFWRPEMQPHMIRKVAFSQGCREMYPDEYGGMYDQAEVHLEEPLPEGAITIDAEEITQIARDVVAELNVGDALPTSPEPTEEQTEEQFQAALVKTFDARTESLDQDMLRDYLFQAMEKLGVESIPMAKVIIMRDKILDKLIEEIQAKMEEAAQLDQKAPTEPPVEPPPTVPPTEPPVEPPTEPPAAPLTKEKAEVQVVLGKIKNAKTKGIVDIADKYAQEIKDDTINTEILIELAPKFKKLTKVKIRDYVEGKVKLGENPEPEGEEEFKGNVRKLQTQAVGKLGRERAEMLYYEVLGTHGATSIGEVDPSSYEAILADYKERIEHSAAMPVSPDAEKNQ